RHPYPHGCFFSRLQDSVSIPLTFCDRSLDGLPSPLIAFLAEHVQRHRSTIQQLYSNWFLKYLRNDKQIQILACFMPAVISHLDLKPQRLEIPASRGQSQSDLLRQIRDLSRANLGSCCRVTEKLNCRILATNLNFDVRHCVASRIV